MFFSSIGLLQKDSLLHFNDFKDLRPRIGKQRNQKENFHYKKKKQARKKNLIDKMYEAESLFWFTFNKVFYNN